MKKKPAIAALILVLLAAFVCGALLLFRSPQPSPVQGELLLNPEFVLSGDASVPENWYLDAYQFNAEYTAYEIQRQGGPEGKTAVHITNMLANDARIAQQIAVEPDSLYCLSGFVRAEARGGWGANLSVKEAFAHTEPLFDTGGAWQQVMLYGRTGKDQRQLTVFCRLGGYSGEAEGEAWFSGVSLQRISKVPSHTEVQNLFNPPQKSEGDVSSLDMRHFLLLFLLLLSGWMVYRLVKKQSLQGLLIMAAISAALAALLAWRQGNGEGGEGGLLSQPGALLLLLLALLFTACAVSFLALTCLRYRQRLARDGVEAETEQEEGRPFRLDRKDLLLMLLMTTLYGALAFINLGAVQSPQTFFTFSQAGESVVYDLGAEQKDVRMLYFAGIHQKDNGFSVQSSPDGQQWRDCAAVSVAPGDLFRWTYVEQSGAPLALSGRYIRLTAREAGLTLFETLFRDQNGFALAPRMADSLGQNADALADEENVLQGEPSWFNSMYFDEIYHARTAYEFLHGLTPYEITHPQLGKVLMSWGVALFGMTPFGWRFSGAACGVMMLPALYLMGRLLFKKRRYAILCCLLLALDTMHFTQTRIATIDSYVVVFILWSVYFMLRWFFAPFFTGKLGKSLGYLSLSGAFMGLAVASKWTGCFAGVGLAILFFYGLFQRMRQMLKARAVPEEKRSEAAKAMAQEGKGRLIKTLVSCLVFFVLVPAAIYGLSYIPFFASRGGVTLSGVVNEQKYMLWYHSTDNRGMDHPYYSPWYQWPLSQKPMYYASHRFTAPGYTYSIMAFGNYAVWWVGFAAVLAVFCLWIKRQALPALGGEEKKTPGDCRPFLLIVLYAVQFLPWALVPRGTYIYHYFPSVPFAILCTSYVFEAGAGWLETALKKKPGGEARADRWSLAAVWGYIALAAILFLLFFPMASGVTVPRGWMDAANWFGNMYY